MKPRSLLAVLLLIATLATAGCTKEEAIRDVYTSPNFSFSEDMVSYMIAYTKDNLKSEMRAAGVDTTKPLDQQEKSDGITWQDYLYDKTVEAIEDILYYCEAALAEPYTIGEGMIYKAEETVSYMTAQAEEAGMTAEEYLREAYGDMISLDSFKICVQMMCLCEGYDLYLSDSFDISEDEVLDFAENEPEKLLKFDALRYTTKDKDVADKLSAASDRDEFVQIMSGISGTDRTDSDKNGIPDAIEITDTIVASDIAGSFANEDSREVGDTTITEADGKYTVTMLLSLPEKSTEPLWDFRAIYISPEASTDPVGDAASLLEQWKEKEGGEEGFANLAARYSDDPTAYYGGLFHGTPASELPSFATTVWMCTDTRAEGDTTVIPLDEGAVILYYIDGNTETWYHEAVDIIKTEKANKKINEFKEGIKDDMVLSEELMLKTLLDYLAEKE